MQRLSLGLTHTLKLEGPPSDDREAFDLAFTRLTPPQAAVFESTGYFLDLNRNLQKFQSEPDCEHIDAIFGLVDEFTGEPVREAGRLTTPLRGVLTPGGVRAQHLGAMTFIPMDLENPEFPTSFGGNSGGGLWRTFFIEKDGQLEIVDTRLCGVASFEIREPRAIICQGIGRLAVLVEKVVSGAS